MQTCDGDEKSDEYEKQENGPSVDPYLGQSSTESEVRGDIGYRVWCGSLCILSSIGILNHVIASRERRRHSRKRRRMLIPCERHADYGV